MQHLVPIVTEEERQYAARLVASGQVERLQRELDELLAALRHFDALYRGRLATVNDEIESLRAEIATSRERIQRLKQRLQSRDGAAMSDVGDDDEFEPPVGATFEDVDPDAVREQRKAPPASDKLRDLYRVLAKRFHPDLARSDDERRRREEMMLRINEAYRTRNLAALASLEAETAPDPALAGRDAAAERLAWATLELARLDTLASDIAEHIAALRASRTHVYWAAGEGIDAAIAELEREAAERLARLRARRDELAEVHRRLKLKVDTRDRFRLGARLRAS
jgi:DNA repair exonuclease SbcCD ATPase subunit